MTTTAAASTPTAFAPPSSLRGRFLWTDLMVPDVGAATGFYPAVTGWTLTPWAMGDGVPPYVMWTNGAAPIGGVMQLSADETAHGAAPRWLAYIGTPDVDATSAEALALGARTIVPPTDIPTVGRFAILADPQGAGFAIFQPSTVPAPVPPAAVPGVGEFSWFELATTDAPAALTFYTQLFGWDRTEEFDMGPGGMYQMFGQGGVTFGAIFNPGTTVSPEWLLYVRVADMTRALEAVRRGGGQVLREPHEVPGGDYIARCADPLGVQFALHASGHASAHASAHAPESPPAV